MEEERAGCAPSRARARPRRGVAAGVGRLAGVGVLDVGAPCLAGGRRAGRGASRRPWRTRSPSGLRVDVVVGRAVAALLGRRPLAADERDEVGHAAGERRLVARGRSPFGRGVPARYGMGEGSARASSIVWPVSATIQTCLNAACAGVVDELSVAGVLPLAGPESLGVELSGVEVRCGGVGRRAGPPRGAVGRRGGGRRRCRPVARPWAATARRGRGGLCGGRPAAGGGATTIVGGRAADASVASACGPAAARPRSRSRASAGWRSPATRREGSGHAVAPTRAGGGRRRAGAASACVLARAASGSSPAARGARRSSGNSAGRRPADRRTPHRAGPGVRGPGRGGRWRAWRRARERGGRGHPRPPATRRRVNPS